MTTAPDLLFPKSLKAGIISSKVSIKKLYNEEGFFILFTENQNIMNHEILKKIGYNSVALEMLLKREAQINTDNLQPEQDDSDFETLYNLQNKLLDFMEEVRTAEIPRKTQILDLLEQAFDIVSDSKNEM